LSDGIQPCAPSASIHRTISGYDGSWKYVTNSGGGDSVVPWLPGTPWQTFMY